MKKYFIIVLILLAFSPDVYAMQTNAIHISCQPEKKFLVISTLDMDIKTVREMYKNPSFAAKAWADKGLLVFTNGEYVTSKCKIDGIKIKYKVMIDVASHDQCEGKKSAFAKIWLDNNLVFDGLLFNECFFNTYISKIVYAGSGLRIDGGSVHDTHTPDWKYSQYSQGVFPQDLKDRGLELPINNAIIFNDGIEKLNISNNLNWQKYFNSDQIISIKNWFIMSSYESKLMWNEAFKNFNEDAPDFDNVYYGKQALTKKQNDHLFNYMIHLNNNIVRKEYGDLWKYLKTNEKIAIEDIFFDTSFMPTKEYKLQNPYAGQDTRFYDNIRKYINAQKDNDLESAKSHLNDARWEIKYNSNRLNLIFSEE